MCGLLFWSVFCNLPVTTAINLLSLHAWVCVLTLEFVSGVVSHLFNVISECLKVILCFWRCDRNNKEVKHNMSALCLHYLYICQHCYLNTYYFLKSPALLKPNLTIADLYHGKFSRKLRTDPWGWLTARLDNITVAKWSLSRKWFGSLGAPRGLRGKIELEWVFFKSRHCDYSMYVHILLCSDVGADSITE